MRQWRQTSWTADDFTPSSVSETALSMSVVVKRQVMQMCYLSTCLSVFSLINLLSCVSIKNSMNLLIQEQFVMLFCSKKPQLTTIIFEIFEFEKKKKKKGNEDSLWLKPSRFELGSAACTTTCRGETETEARINWGGLCLEEHPAEKLWQIGRADDGWSAMMKQEEEKEKILIY